MSSICHFILSPLMYRASCGVYVIKYMEKLAVGTKDLTTVTDEYVQAIRHKLAFDFLHNSYTFGLLE